jgi:hypothetical protein
MRILVCHLCQFCFTVIYVLFSNSGASLAHNILHQSYIYTSSAKGAKQFASTDCMSSLLRVVKNFQHHLFQGPPQQVPIIAPLLELAVRCFANTLTTPEGKAFQIFMNQLSDCWLIDFISIYAV